MSLMFSHRNVPPYCPPEEFPLKQMAVLLCASIAGSLCLTGLFPYIAYMVVDLGAAPDVDRAGYISGYVSSAFLFGRLVSSFYWGRVSDKRGRLPILYMSCISIIIFSIAFGLSVTIWMAILSRFLLGLFNPIAGLVKTLVSEICGPKHEKSGMALTTGAWSVGLLVGPAVGGFLARPVEQYPELFGNSDFLRQFPYLLPNVFTAFVATIALVLVSTYFPETLAMKDDSTGTGGTVSPTADTMEDRNALDRKGEVDVSDIVVEVAKCEQESYNDGDGAYLLCNDSGPTEEQQMSNGYHGIAADAADERDTSDRMAGKTAEEPYPEATTKGNNRNPRTEGESHWQALRRLMCDPAVSVLMLSYFVISFNAIIYDEVLPLWALSSVEKGGLGYDSSDVGQIMSLVGIPVVVFTFLGYPFLAKKFHEPTCFRLGQLLGGVTSFITVLLRYLLPVLGGSDAINANNSTSKWVLQLLLVVLSSLCHVSYVTGFTSLFLLINRSVHTDHRATVNGLAMTIGSIAKAVGPILGSVMYAWSIENNLSEPFNFILVFVMCLLISILMMAVPRRLFEQVEHLPSSDGDQRTGGDTDVEAGSGSSDDDIQLDEDSETGDDLEMTNRASAEQLSSWRLPRLLPGGVAAALAPFASDKKKLLHNMDCSDDDDDDVCADEENHPKRY